MEPLAEYVDGLPNLCGQEPLISEAITAGRKYPVFPHDADIERAASTFAVALHMHQPLIRSYVIQGIRILAVTWANATRGNSVFWLHAAVRTAIWPSVDDQLGITPRASSDSSGHIFATQKPRFRSSHPLFKRHADVTWGLSRPAATCTPRRSSATWRG